MSPANHSFK